MAAEYLLPKEKFKEFVNADEIVVEEIILRGDS